jgi:hypothetical protein
MWQNVYTLEYIRYGTHWDWGRYHESKMRAYTGEIPDDHPLHMLRRYATGELKISDEIMHKLESGKISLKYHPKTDVSWMDIPELS